jgi:hypothetical protein
MCPLAIDLFTGMHGWAEGLVAEGWDVIGFDIEDMCGQFGMQRPAHVHLVIQDVLTLHGKQFRNAALIVASPPCQEYSYMAMPWSKAKALAADYRSGKRDVKQLTALFDACFRIQREACEAAGHHIPMVVENVKGAQPWVGRARWSFGSFYLWGDVPALMPMTAAIKNSGGSWFAIGSPGQTVIGQNPDGRKTMGHPNIRDGHPHTKHLTNPAEHGALDERRKNPDGMKNPGIDLGDIGFNVASAHQFGHMAEGVKIKRSETDKRQHIGTKRKFASAMIAKIPIPLSRHIAQSFRPMQAAAE